MAYFYGLSCVFHSLCWSFGLSVGNNHEFWRKHLTWSRCCLWWWVRWAQATVGRGKFKGQTGQLNTTYIENAASAVQKRLNQSSCCLRLVSVVCPRNHAYDGCAHWRHLANCAEWLCLMAAVSGSATRVATRPVPKFMQSYCCCCCWCCYYC